MSYVNMTFSLPADLAERLRRRVPADRQSSFVAGAIAAQLDEAASDFDDSDDSDNGWNGDGGGGDGK